jgi:predicted transcriptional regulator
MSAPEEATVVPLTVGRPPHATSAARRETILQLNDEGMSGVAIARQIGVTPAAVSYHLKKARLAAENVLAQAG